MKTKNNKVMVVAKKEFLDSMTSKVFIVIFSVFLLLTLATTVAGINSYRNQLNDYQQSQADNKGEDMTFSGYPEPQVVNIVFGGMVEYIAIIGAILAIILGFNAISGEKKRGNLKTVLSYPLYRDNLINGKFLGKIGVLILTLVISSLIGIIAVITMGIKLAFGDISTILLFLLISSIYLIVFFGISMLFSVLCKSDSSSLLFSIIVWVVSAMLIAPLATMAVNIVSPQENFFQASGDVQMGEIIELTDEEYTVQDKIFEESFKKLEDRWGLESKISAIVSPTDNYQQIANSIVGQKEGSIINMNTDDGSISSVSDRIMGKMINIVMLLLLAVTLLAATYIKFMRQDIR